MTTPTSQPKAVVLGSSNPNQFALETALFALLCFLPTLTAGFVYDDVLLIEDNHRVQSLRWLPEAFTRYFWQLGDEGSGGLLYYRPLITVSYIVNWVASGGKPWLFHFTNAVVHAGATYLVVLLVRRWTERPILAIAAALVFALHPSRTESVIWIAGRTDVFMTFFMLLSAEAAYRTRRPRSGMGLALCLSSFLAALLCKEAAVILPLLLLPDVLSSPDRGEKRRLARTLGLQVAIAIVYVILRVFVFPVRPSGATEFTPKYGLLTIFAYVERTIWPWPQTFYHRPLETDSSGFVFPTLLVVAGGVVIAGYLVLLILAFRRDRLGALLLATAVVSFGPLLNFTHTDIFVTTSDHFLYLPIFFFVAGVCRTWRNRLARLAEVPTARVVFAAVLVVYLILDVARVRQFMDQKVLFRHELSLNRWNPLVLKTLSELEAQGGHIDEAFELLVLASRPESRKYKLLLPSWLHYQNYFRMLGLLAARTADGNRHELELIYRELEAVLAGGRERVDARVGELQLGQRLLPDQQHSALKLGARQALTAEAAFLATRLGKDGRARELLRSLTEDDFQFLPNPMNVALAMARVQDFTTAKHWLNSLSREAPRRFPEERMDPETKRLSTAEELFRSANAATGTEQQALRAQGYLELGAYLRGLLELRPVLDEIATRADLGPLYVHLLLGAGLDREAMAIAQRAMSPQDAAQWIESIRMSMSKKLGKLRKPAETTAWYAAEDAAK